MIPFFTRRQREGTLALAQVEALHQPYWSVPVEITDDPVLTTDGVAGDWHEATPFDQIVSGMWWCDACRRAAPCPTWLAIHPGWTPDE